MYAGAIPIAIEGGSVYAIATDGTRPFWVLGSHDPEVHVAPLQTRKPNDEEAVELTKVPDDTGLAVFRGRVYWSTKRGVESLPLPR